ncbi:MAG: DUF3352 domain-containing protein [Actinomycetota bacterium]|nr:DUF3352 domain-containing protein [Actinomycetota bacterium]MDQ3647459.1 DUF3352 domain-containing protein [Actinomycetota bacterium]
MPRLALSTVVSLLAAGLLAGCGSGTEQPAALAPAQALFYGEVNLTAPGGQKAAVDALARKFPGSGSAGQRLGALIDDGLRDGDAKVSFERDVKPWLGDKAAFFASRPPGGGSGDTPVAALVAAKDEEKALATVQKEEGQGTEAEYEGVKYRRFGDKDSVATTLDGYLVLSNELGLKALVNASKNSDRTLESSERFKRALEGRPEDRLGFAYVDAASALDAVPSAQAQLLAPFRRALRDPLVVTATAQSDALEITSETPESLLSVLGVAGLGSKGTNLIGKLPGDSLFASGGPELGRQLAAGIKLGASSFGGPAILEQALRQRTGLDLQRDVLAWMGDYGIFVRGQDRGSLGGALVVESKDPAATRRAIAGLRRILRGQGRSGARIGRLGIRGADAGFTVTVDDLPAPFNVFLKSDRFVVAYGNAAASRAINPRGTLEDDSTFSQATGSLGGGYVVNTYASVPAALRLAKGLGATRGSGYQQAMPYLTVLGALVGAAKPGGDGKLESKFRLTVPG